MKRGAFGLGCAYRIAGFSILLGLAGACGGQGSRGARLSLTLVENPEVVQASLAASDASTLDLGEIRGTRDFLFLLRNLGTDNATDIALTTDRDDFLVAPAHISVLEPDDRSAILPLVRVTVVHGIAPNGPGLAPLMPMGPHTATLAIAGTNFDAVSLGLTVDAKVMDVDVLDGDVPIDLTQTHGGLASTLGGLGFVQIHWVSGQPSIKNTGNVPIEVRLFEVTGDTMISKQPLDVQAVMPLSFPTDSPFLEVGIAGQTVTDNSRLPLGNDGVAYFALTPPPPP